MMQYSNPFTPVFGNEPPILAGRSQLIDNVINGLESGPGEPNRITIFTGPRGSGKTVLLTAIANKAEEIGWIAVHTSASEQMLAQFIEQIERQASSFLPKKSKSKITGLQVSGVGFQREIKDEKPLTWRAQIEAYLEILAEQNIGLLFTVDEIMSDCKEMVEFISTFQFFIREKRNVALIMAGLPNKVLQMFQNSSISFLRRAFNRRLDPISMPEVRAVIKKTVELAGRNIETNALEEAAEKTQGFPFMIQLIGYHSFNQSNRKTISLDNVNDGIEEAKYDMERMILDISLFELSDMDIRFLKAMLYDVDVSRMSDITKRMKTSASNASHYKRRLVNQGLLSEAGRGKVIFSMPMMKDMLQEKFQK